MWVLETEPGFFGRAVSAVNFLSSQNQSLLLKNISYFLKNKLYIYGFQIVPTNVIISWYDKHGIVFGLIKHCLHYMFIKSYAFAKTFHEYNCITSQCNGL